MLFEDKHVPNPKQKRPPSRRVNLKLMLLIVFGLTTIVLVGLIWLSLGFKDNESSFEAIIVYQGQLSTRSEMVQHSLRAAIRNFTDVEIHDSSPDISPDGQKIAFSRSYGEGFSIHVMDIDGNNIQQLITHGVIPSWSPDGQQIAFTSIVETNDVWKPYLYVMNADGSGVRLLTTNVKNVSRISWSPDGTQLVLDSRFDSSQPTDIYTINVDGSNFQNITANFDYNVFFPTWSPDGQSIAFNCVIDSYEICLKLINSEEIVQLTENKVQEWYPVWLPDASGLLFLSKQATRTGDVYAYYFEDGTTERITWVDYDVYKTSFDFTIISP